MSFLHGALFRRYALRGRRYALQGFAVCLLLGPLATGAESPRNVVLIVADDLGWSDLGCYGSTFYETPALDKLASEGMRFTDAYASAPVCSPSRAAIMTGKNPTRLGVTAHIGDAHPHQWSRETPLLPASYVDRLPLEELTLAERLHEAGYATLHAGKWHLGGEPFYPEYQGFDLNLGGWVQGGPFTGQGYFSPHGNPRLTDGPAGEYLTDRLAAETARFIEYHHREPFFVHLAFYAVHVPLQARPDLLRKYEKKAAGLPRIVSPMREGPDSLLRVRQDLPVYAAMVEAMDQGVGVVMEALERYGLRDNTIVIFTSDNGGLSTGDRGISEAEGWPTTNAPLRAGKGWLYEGGIRVPLIVRAPGVEAGTTSDRVVTGTDYFTTIEELAELPPAEIGPHDSESFVANLHGKQESRGPAFWHYPHYGNQGGRPGAVMRDGDWKLIEWYGGTPAESDLELFDLQADPSEEHNLAHLEANRVEQMLTALRSWRKGLDAQMPTGRTVPIAKQPEAPRAAGVPSAEPASR
ncbi:sulfatase [Botrimarina hoheduenensis]|uniref:Arylsulfatase n=1 Tax=Botrimarina hoheduenensis TaxID=2528000 RepID=A0A5C5VWX8_9BACT|nr:sulfatase [Botrimarina hoheduenensis]TWT42890.1 Arylsulfatase [Botrimarina hoheduenensis]